MRTVKLLHDVGSKRVKYLFTAKVLKWSEVSILASRRDEVQDILKNSKEYLQFKSIKRDAKRY